MEPIKKSLEQLLKESSQAIARMSPTVREAFLRVQRESWVRAEIQWAKDFCEGKCKRD